MCGAWSTSQDQLSIFTQKNIQKIPVLSLLFLQDVFIYLFYLFSFERLQSLC